jgi:hypothetical protein
MAYDLTGLSAYVDELSFELSSRIVLQTDLAQYVNVRAGLKGTDVKIPLLSGDFVTADGLTCGFDGSSNNQDVTQVSMTLVPKKYNSAMCPTSLQEYFLGQALAAGQMGGNESIPFEELTANYFVERLKKWNEDFLTQGDGTVNGLEGIVQAANGAATQSTVAAAAWTASNAITQAQSLYEALPEKSINRDDLIMVVSPSYKRALALAITQENYFHISPDQEIFVPGTSVRVVENSGLSGRDYAMVGPAQMIIMGCDLTGDFEQFKLWYSEDNDEVRAMMRWKIGIAVTEVNAFAENGL